MKIRRRAPERCVARRSGSRIHRAGLSDMRAIAVQGAPLSLQSSSAWTALTGVRVSWPKGLNNETTMPKRSDMRSCPRQQGERCVSDKGGEREREGAGTARQAATRGTDEAAAHGRAGPERPGSGRKTGPDGRDGGDAERDGGRRTGGSGRRGRREHEGTHPPGAGAGTEGRPAGRPGGRGKEHGAGAGGRRRLAHQAPHRPPEGTEAPKGPAGRYGANRGRRRGAGRRFGPAAADAPRPSCDFRPQETGDE